MLNCDGMILAGESSCVLELQGDDGLLEPAFSAGDGFDAARNSLWSTRAQPSLTSMTLIETVPATQEYNITTSCMNSWETECIPTLHTFFLRLQCFNDQTRVLEVAMKALAACQLSRRSFRGRPFRTRKLPLCRTTPNLDHEALAHQFYGAAIRLIRLWDPSSSSTPKSTVLAVMILFCCLESVMGNFKAFSLHSSGLQKLLDTEPFLTGEHDRPISSLLAAWTQAKMHNWWLRLHFSSPATHYNAAALSLPREVRAEPQKHTRLTILHTLCESCRIRHASLASLWYGVQTDDLSPSVNITWYPAGSETLGKSLYPLSTSYDSVPDSLMATRKSLNEWHARLSSAEKPIDNMCNRHDIGLFNSDSLEIRPIRFATHLAAMNYAYYYAARVMNCSGVPGLPHGVYHHGNIHDDDVDYWATALLQLTAGLDWSNCLRFNVHTIGIVSLLFVCVLRATNPAIGAWMEDWMIRQGVSEDTEEGSFPNLQILQALRLVNAERCAGRNVLAVYQPTDDGGGAGKYGSYTSQNITCFLVFGRCRGTGMLYSRYSAV
jgi:hypothetical protein